MRKHWLIAAFEPFAGRGQNNSKNVIDEMQNVIGPEGSDLMADDRWNHVFHYEVLPVVYSKCFSALTARIQALKAEGITLEGVLGIGEGFEEFKMETQAHNIDDVPGFHDNAGDARTAVAIFSDMPLGAPMPLRFPTEAFGRIRRSTSAGYFVCNHLAAEMAHAWGKGKDPAFFGFIHVPRVGEGGVFTADVCASMIVNGFKRL
jgi:pyrrolidone-carboxylate peptidase